ncbi:hypothetical protein JD974_12115 [Chromobacterium haemolyticum]|uniref:Zona occludens toxin N-terminal domain-containing protein n=1 Tax=Chromobacterium haemolyticum TaxID=394935 RepID=A0ABS3GNP4_9NEIS|nr:zonular occludens toxin domain-containing protein [Chromobacterium haemolyticum]MBK0415149.1 hypothetical protein [Chromobacterium haemolyticum]MBO0416637.1 hypothetical protein [Chromobacterium haemolyticum]MBO0499787.1 hypothetical protein [Chromobacterium haemolyticum]
MIYLITAVPGSGKTLYTLEWLKEKSEQENRQVYVSGIPLTDEGKKVLDWKELDDPEKWYELPAGAIVVIDECQRVFPVRRSGNGVPKHVSMFETHRHLGIDVVLITQHPSLMDSHIRKLVGTHKHLIRMFGAQRSTLATWQEGIQENPNNKSALKNCLDKKTFVYPKHVYSWYKSSEMHTHKLVIPKKVKWLIALAVFVIVALFAMFYMVYQIFVVEPKKQAEAMSIKTSASAPSGNVLSPSVQQGSPKIVKTSQTFLSDRQPRVDGIPESAPAYDELTTPRTFPKVTACLSSKSKCSCFNQQGTAIQMEEYRCRYYVEKGWFDPYIDQRENREREIMASRSLQASAPIVVAMAQPTVNDFGSKENFPRSFK